eukprot:scaffold19617_cov127-Isochrysis_galbana.AAC.3
MSTQDRAQSAEWRALPRSRQRQAGHRSHPTGGGRRARGKCRPATGAKAGCTRRRSDFRECR